MTASEIVAGRSCGTCTLCCKVVAVTELGKPAGVWCPHCVRDKGCAIYETRPDDCRTFYCHWMVEPGLSAAWKPERSKFALLTSESGITAFVDPGFPSAWRREPYYGTLKRWAADSGAGRIVSVRIGTRAIVVFADREVDLGEVAPGETIRIEPGPGGRLEARKRPASPH